MFRNSEIYALIRQRQVRKENEEAEFGVEAASATEKPKVTSTHEPEDLIVDEGDSGEDEEEYLRFLETEKRKAEANNERNKRRKTKPDAHTHRRIARELDIVAIDEQMLDYDEGPSKPTEASNTDSQRHMGEHQARDRRPEGRTIWWPYIQEGWMEGSFQAVHLYYSVPRPWSLSTDCPKHEVGVSRPLSPCHKLCPNRNIHMMKKILSSSLVGRVNPAEVPLSMPFALF